MSAAQFAKIAIFHVSRFAEKESFEQILKIQIRSFWQLSKSWWYDLLRLKTQKQSKIRRCCLAVENYALMLKFYYKPPG